MILSKKKHKEITSRFIQQGIKRDIMYFFIQIQKNYEKETNGIFF